MTIQALPTPPTRQDPVNFAERADAFFAALPNFQAQANELQADVNLRQAQAQAAAQAAQADRIMSAASALAVASANPAANAAAAKASADAAAVYASQAQAVTPDAPVRFNTNTISADLTVPRGYNASSTGPIRLAEGVVVTVQDSAAWSIS